jgi:hypothetical protein
MHEQIPEEAATDSVPPALMNGLNVLAESCVCIAEKE